MTRCCKLGRVGGDAASGMRSRPVPEYVLEHAVGANSREIHVHEVDLMASQ